MLQRAQIKGGEAEPMGSPDASLAVCLSVWLAQSLAVLCVRGSVEGVQSKLCVCVVERRQLISN